MLSNHDLKAIIWDYDNTLVDTRLKNYNVTRQIIADVTGKNADDFIFLASLEGYLKANSLAPSWRSMYSSELGLTEEQTDTVGRLWTDYQRNNQTPVTFFHGIGDVLQALRYVPHGIVSQNSRESIARALQGAGCQDYFKYILGYEEVDIRKQKPHPDGLVNCLDKIAGLAPGIVVSIGDHETDIQSAINANTYFAQTGLAIRVFSIWAAYGAFTDVSSWKIKPDFVASKIEEIIGIVEGL
jgi:HAD superfamily hydrolase (TIGR01549 family)